MSIWMAPGDETLSLLCSVDEAAEALLRWARCFARLDPSEADLEAEFLRLVAAARQSASRIRADRGAGGAAP
jgi:hypothetical protein